MLIDLLILLVILLIISYIFSKNVFSPSCIFCAMFIVSVVFANYAADGWNFQLSKKGFFILICGIISFVISSLLIHLLMEKRAKKINYISSLTNVSEIHIFTSALVPLVIMFIAMALFYYLSLCRITGTSGLDVASSYRNMSRANEIEMGTIGRWILNILRASSTTVVVVLVNNHFSKSLLKNHGIVLVSLVLIYVMLTLLSGERTSVIRIIGVAVLSFGVFWKKKNPRKVFPIKYLLFGILLFIGILYGFSAIRFFVGRSSQLDVVDYIAFYFGSPIYNFDYGVNNLAYLEGNKGHTFLGLANNLARLGIGDITSVHRLNVTSSSLHIFFGNTYTCLFDYYADFGLVGMIILMAVFGGFITFLYCSALHEKRIYIYKTVMYSFFGTTVFFAAFTEQLYSTYIAINTLIMIVTIYVTIRFLKTKRISSLIYKIGKLV